MFTVGTSAPTLTQTPAPTLTPTPIPTVGQVMCSPRPPVQVRTTPSGGALQVNVTATGENNRLLSLQFAQTSNALVDVGGQTGRTGAFTAALSGASANTTFTVRRNAAGAATVSLSVVDRCGSWTTLVGGGAGSF